MQIQKICTQDIYQLEAAEGSDRIIIEHEEKTIRKIIIKPWFADEYIIEAHIFSAVAKIIKEGGYKLEEKQ